MRAVGRGSTTRPESISGDRCAEGVVADYDVEYVAHDRNRGQAAGWRTGFDVTSGEFVQFLDDDRLHGRKVGRQVGLFEGRSETGVVYCGFETVYGRTVRPEPAVRGVVLQDVLTFDLSPIITSTLLCRRSALEAVAPFPDYEVGTDIPLVIRLADQTEFDFVDEPLVVRSEREDSKGVSMAAPDARWRILDEYEDLYDRRPEVVRQRAVANAARFQGLVYLTHSTWSWRAIASFSRVILADPSPRPTAVARLLASLFGAPGLKASHRLAQRVSSSDRE